MKLFKKLIPLASIAAVSAAVVPMAASCSKSLKGITIDLEDIIWNGYKRQIEALPASTKISKANGLKTYLEAINDQPALVADDTFDYLALSLERALDGDTTMLRNIVSPIVKANNYGDDITDIIIQLLLKASGKITISGAKVDVDDRRMSLDASLDIKGPINYNGVKTDLEINLDINVKDIRVNMLYDTNPVIVGGRVYHYWNMYADYYHNEGSGQEGSVLLMGDDQWSISTTGYVKSDFFGLTGDINLDANFSCESDLMELQLINSIMLKADAPAMYFRNITPSDEQ